MTTTQSKGSTIKGILGVKLGMTQVFDENNKVIPVTVVEAGPCVVTQVRTLEKDGYEAVQLAFGAIDPKKVTKLIWTVRKSWRYSSSLCRRDSHRFRC